MIRPGALVEEWVQCGGGGAGRGFLVSNRPEVAGSAKRSPTMLHRQHEQCCTGSTKYPAFRELYNQGGNGN